MKKTKKQKPTFIILLIILLNIVIIFFLFTLLKNKKKTNESYYFSKSLNNQYDFSQIFPNLNLYKNNYLYTNSDNIHKKRAVIWFKQTSNNKFKMYNSLPYEKCHYDILSWDIDGYLKYYETYDNCKTDNKDNWPKVTKFNPPIIFIPQFLESNFNKWTYSSQTNVEYYEGNRLQSKAKVTYTNNIFPQNLTSNYKSIRFQTIQKNEWYWGKFNNTTSNWEENWWFGDVPLENSSNQSLSLKRTMGGSKDINWPQWDIWFDFWRKLPNKSRK